MKNKQYRSESQGQRECKKWQAGDKKKKWLAGDRKKEVAGRRQAIGGRSRTPISNFADKEEETMVGIVCMPNRLWLGASESPMAGYMPQFLPINCGQSVVVEGRQRSGLLQLRYSKGPWYRTILRLINRA